MAVNLCETLDVPYLGNYPGLVRIAQEAFSRRYRLCGNPAICHLRDAAKAVALVISRQENPEMYVATAFGHDIIEDGGYEMGEGYILL